MTDATDKEIFRRLMVQVPLVLAVQLPLDEEPFQVPATVEPGVAPETLTLAVHDVGWSAALPTKVSCVGGAVVVTGVTVAEVLPVAPRLSVTVSVTENVPPLA